MTAAEIQASVAGQTVPERFMARVAKSGSASAVRWTNADGEWESWSFDQLATEVARLTAGLTKIGIGHGDRVALMLRNRPEFHALDLAVLMCGATPVSLYNSSSSDQIDYMINHCGAKLAVVEGDALLSRFEQVRNRLTTLANIVVLDGSPSETALDFAELSSSEPADLSTAATIAQPSDLATVIYTSGTTGAPKGVRLTHFNVCWTLASVSATMKDQAGIADLTGLRHVSYLPMAHVMERLLGHYYMCALGVESNCCPETSQLAPTVQQVRPDFLIGVPRVWEKFNAAVNAALAADPEKAKSFNEAVEAAIPIIERKTEGTATTEDLETWDFLDAVAFRTVRQMLGLDNAKICISGAAPLAPDVLSWFRAIGVPLGEGYGMSETTSVLTWSYAAKAGTVGQASPGVELMVGEDGEVLARGGNIFDGYLDAPDKTAEALDDDGWLHTGDIGEIDEDGYLTIVDRKKELIITAGGKNISPANLEVALKSIPLVGQACAVGEQRPFVAALVVLDVDASATWAKNQGLSGEEASLTALAQNPAVIAEIEAGLVDAMASFNGAESVKKVKVLGDEWLPDTDLLTPTSKLKRRGILARFEAEIEALYAR